MADKTALLEVIEVERSRHSRMDGRDLQKLIYQSVFGGDHLLEDPTRFAAGFRAEWAGLAAEGAEDVGSALQLIDPAGRTARIHLAVCRRLGVDVERMIALLLGQARKAGRRSDYERRWDEAIALASTGRIPFAADELRRVGYPGRPPRHGPEYGFASYRIVHDISDPFVTEALRRLGVR